MSDRPVIVERHAATMVITYNRPQARNALNRAVSEAVEAALDAFEAQDELRVAVLTGAGGVFCAGMDLKAALTGDLPVTERRGVGGLALRPPAKPIIAAVEGYALAGGFEMALACDLIVAARDAKLGIPEVKRGLVAVGGGLLRLTERAPRAVAIELALTGAPMTAERLYELGIVSRVTEPGQALAVALELAADIARGAPLAVRASKEILDGCTQWTPEERWARQGEIAGPALFSSDAREGATAFAQKREPVWQGC